ncbi:MAG: sigma-70 family RNA polymerase sigma factor [Chloroflexota bacterium]
MKHLAEDDETRFEALFETHWERVCKVVFRLIGNWDEAEDLALETFIRLYRRPHLLGRGQNPEGWLYRVATNLGLNAVRAGQRRKRYEIQAGKQLIEASPPQNPVRETEKREEREHVRRVLSHIRPRSAKLLILRYSGLSYSELAAVLGVSPASIGSMLVRAEREFERCYHESIGDRSCI